MWVVSLHSHYSKSTKSGKASAKRSNPHFSMKFYSPYFLTKTCFSRFEVSKNDPVDSLHRPFYQRALHPRIPFFCVLAHPNDSSLFKANKKRRIRSCNRLRSQTSACKSIWTTSVFSLPMTRTDNDHMNCRNM
jgi:hypothetical protein